jgi:hypothetical protein
MLKYRNAELTLGALFGMALLAGVWGWHDSYALTGKQKDECYEAVKKPGQKSDECKTFCEKTTSDPVAFFTLVLAVSTVEVELRGVTPRNNFRPLPDGSVSAWLTFCIAYKDDGGRLHGTGMILEFKPEGSTQFYPAGIVLGKLKIFGMGTSVF